MTSVISSAGVQDCSAEGLTVDFEESPGLGLFGKSGQENNNFLLSWLNSWQVAPKVSWWTSKNELNLLASTTRTLGLLTSFHARLCCKLKRSNEDFLGKEETSGAFELRASEWDLLASGRHR